MYLHLEWLQGELRDLEEKYKLEASECEQTIEEG